MYKSARYYFKNKSNEKKKAKKRRQYIGLEPEFRDAIDEHIENVSIRQEFKPQDGFINFLDDTKYSEIGTDVEVGKIDGHQKRIGAKVTTFPFYDPTKSKVRA